MIIACILCGGVGEILLISAGLGWLIRWFKKRHDRSKCKCCQGHAQGIEPYLHVADQPMSSKEAEELKEFKEICR